MEADGGIIFFNEAEAVSELDAPEPNDLEQQKAKRPQAKRREICLGLLHMCSLTT